MKVRLILEISATDLVLSSRNVAFKSVHRLWSVCRPYLIEVTLGIFASLIATWIWAALQIP